MLPVCGLAQLPACAPAALALHGALLVDGVGGLATARAAALAHFHACATDGAHRLQPARMDDGARRLSAASRVLRGYAEAFPECDMLDTAAGPLRATVDMVAREVMRSLEPFVLQHGEVLPANGSRWYSSLSDVIGSGEQLEHFHAYVPRPSPAPGAIEFEAPDGAKNAIGLHTDGGLFIAMVPALYGGKSASTGEFESVANPEPETSGLLVELADGTIAGVPEAVEESAVIIVLGEGWKDWLNPSLRTPLRAAPHALKLPKSSSTGSSVRLWYGRMYLPPQDALLPPHGVMFADHRAAEISLFGSHAADHGRELEVTLPHVHHVIYRDDVGTRTAIPRVMHAQASRALALLPIGCAGGKRFVRNLAACDTNQIYCWHQCMDVSSLECGNEASCRAVDGTLWTDPNDGSTNHCMSCQPVCDASPPPPVVMNMSMGDHHHASPPASPAFCTGHGTAMHMAGFEAVRSDCTILLFPEWKLDTEAAFAGGVIGTFVLAVATEWLMAARRAAADPKCVAAHNIRDICECPITFDSCARRFKWMQAKPVAWRLINAAGFTLQVFMGYFLMLIAMTYQVELFLAVVFGLGFGHFLLNGKAPVGEFSDPCCIETVS